MRRLPLVLILLIAFGLRAWNLTGVPPGLTHDEANHGREGMSILDGDLRLYYPLNYGSEPLYSYTVAGSMAVFGETLFALRLVGVFFGLLTTAATFAWSRTAFGRRVGLLAAALIAVSYWPLVTSRMALRATLLPFYLLLAVWCFWRLLEGRRRGAHAWGWAVGFAIFVGVTLYIYLAARVLWLVFLIFFIYLLVTDRRLAGRVGLPLAGGLALAGFLVIPMFVYLDFFPEAETRLQMLDSPLQRALSGDIAPVWRNAWQALAALIWPGYGDHFLAYNIPGRPVLGAAAAFFALIGLGVCLWRWRRPSHAFVLIWLGIGLIPSLITGPTANTTRNIGILPVLYLLPALGFSAVIQAAAGRGWESRWGRWAFTTGAAIWLAGVGYLTARDYFVIWPQLPEVRAAYQTTIIAAVTEAGERVPSGQPVMFSSVYPGSAHDNSIALVIAAPNEKERPVRWMDGRLALLFPSGTGSVGMIDLFAPASADLHPLFREWSREAGRVAQRPTDLDPFFTHYQIAQPALPAEPLADFGGGIELLESRWLASPEPGEVGELLTMWRVKDPTRVGPVVWPIETTDVSFFLHVLQPDGGILIQDDRLDAPSWGWQAGDLVVQIFQVWVAPETPPGRYPAIIGVYDRQSGARLAVEEIGRDFAPLPDLVIGAD